MLGDKNLVRGIFPGGGEGGVGMSKFSVGGRTPSIPPPVGKTLLHFILHVSRDFCFQE